MAQSLQKSYEDLKGSFMNAIRALTVALEAKDPYTKGHSERVSRYCKKIADEMHIPATEVQVLEDLAVMHDIGKIGVHEDILNKPEILTDRERSHIQQHTTIGEDILKPISFFDKRLLQLIRSHHERPDGTGYPDGLRGDQIPLVVSILTVADAFDAMTTDRPYRKALSVPHAVRELLLCAGSQYNTDVVNALQRILEKEGAMHE